ncbi:MAG: ABC transporter permease [Treponemataceae bacterium]|nr:ABC transporter permease [Treponemataceae bacterium]
MGILLAIEGAVSQGVLWGIMTLGLYLTFRILDMADLTVDGSFATGGAVTAVMIVAGVDPLVSLIVVFISGMLCGLCTGLLHTKLKINILLSSILTQIALYSINIRIMGRANTPLIGVKTIMSFCMKNMHMTSTVASLFVGSIFAVILIAILYWFFGTELGSAIRATGANQRMATAMGINTDNLKMLGLMISNGLVALSGALVAQSQGYADVGMGTGTIVIGLASVIIGEVIFGNRFGFWWILLSALLGSVVYRIIIAVVLQLGLKSTDMKLFTAIIVAIALSMPVIKERTARRKQKEISK